MEAVRTRLDRRTDDSTLKIAKLGRRVLRDQVEFLNRIGRWSKSKQIVRDLIVIHAVQDEVVRLFAVAVDVWSGSAGSVVTIIEAVGIG